MKASKRIIALSLIISLITGNMFGAMAATLTSVEAKAAADLASFTVGTTTATTASDTASQTFGQIAPVAECKIIQRVAIEPGVCRTQAEQTAIEAELAAQAKIDADAIVASIKDLQKTAAADAVKAAAAVLAAQKAADAATKAADLANKTLLTSVTSYNNTCGTSKTSGAAICTTLRTTLEKNGAAKETADNAKIAKAQEAVEALAKSEISKKVVSDAATNLTAATKTATTAAQIAKDTAAKVAVDVAQAKKEAAAQAAVDKAAAALGAKTTAKAAVVPVLNDKQKEAVVTQLAGEVVAEKAVTDYMANVQASIDKGTAPAWALASNTSKANYYASQKVFADNLGVKTFNDAVSSVEKKLGVDLKTKYEAVLKSDTAAASAGLTGELKNIIQGLKDDKFMSFMNTKNDPRIQQTVDLAKDLTTKGVDPFQATFQAINKIYGPYNKAVQAMLDEVKAINKKGAAILLNKKLTYQQRYDQVIELAQRQQELTENMLKAFQKSPDGSADTCYAETICRQRTVIAQDVLKKAFNFSTTAFIIKPTAATGNTGHVLLRASLGGFTEMFIDPSISEVTIGGSYELAFKAQQAAKGLKPAVKALPKASIKTSLNTITPLDLYMPPPYSVGNIGAPSFPTLPTFVTLADLGSLTMGSFNLAGPGTLTKPTTGGPLANFSFGSGGNFDFPPSFNNNGGAVIYFQSPSD